KKSRMLVVARVRAFLTEIAAFRTLDRRVGGLVLLPLGPQPHLEPLQGLYGKPPVGLHGLPRIQAGPLVPAQLLPCTDHLGGLLGPVGQLLVEDPDRLGAPVGRPAAPAWSRLGRRPGVVLAAAAEDRHAQGRRLLEAARRRELPPRRLMLRVGPG